MRPPLPQGRGAGGGGALGRRAFASLLGAAVVALALLCLFYGAAFAPSIRRAHPRLPLRLRFRGQGTEALPADLVVSSIPVRTAAAQPPALSASFVNGVVMGGLCFAACADPACVCRGVRNRTGVRRAALGADPMLGQGPPLPAPAPAQPLPHGALRAPLPAGAAPPQLPHPTAQRLPGEGEATDHRL
jgi:hypothetical protein